MNQPGKLKLLSLSAWKILMTMFRNSNAIHIRLNFQKMRKLEKMAILIQVLFTTTHALPTHYLPSIDPSICPRVLIWSTYALSTPTSFSVIVVNDADMDNNGKVEFSIKQDQPTFGIFSKAGFSSNQIASVYRPIREKRLIFNIFDEKLK